MEPNKENIQKLVDALRSGEYTQGRGFLTQILYDGSEQDCCLGVGCKVAIKNGADIAVTTQDGVTIRYYEGEGRLPPKAFEDFYGFNSSFFFRDSVYNGPLPFFNDAVCSSFDEIADMLESTFLVEA